MIDIVPTTILFTFASIYITYTLIFVVVSFFFADALQTLRKIDLYASVCGVEMPLDGDKKCGLYGH